MFRYKKSAASVSYNRQGYIYFYSLLYDELPEAARRHIEAVAAEAGGEYAEAVLRYVTTDDGAVKICEKHKLDQSTLHRAVARYYELF